MLGSGAFFLGGRTLSFSLFLWLFLAIAVFWAVGVYNRLVRLRARARDALGSLDKSLGQQVELVCRRFDVAADAPDVRAALKAVTDVPAIWSGLVDAVGNMDAALRLWRTQPLDAPSMQAVALAADALQLHWVALISAPADLAGATVPDDMRAEWDVAAEKSKSVRGAVNQILTQHDEAIAQFPARLLAGFMGFTPAGQL